MSGFQPILYCSLSAIAVNPHIRLYPQLQVSQDSLIALQA